MWWLYRCSLNAAMVPERIRVSSGSTNLFPDLYEVNISGMSGMYSSSLKIKNISQEETSGLYRCEAYALPSNPFLYEPPATTDFFIVGKRKSLRDCFSKAPSYQKSMGNGMLEKRSKENANGLLETIQNLITAAMSESHREPRNQNDTFEYLLQLPQRDNSTQDYKIRFSTTDNRRKDDNELLKDVFPAKNVTNQTTSTLSDINFIPFNISDAIPFPNFAVSSDNFLSADDNLTQPLVPPKGQETNEIPIQNSSYARFDFTGGRKIQNWGGPS